MEDASTPPPVPWSDLLPELLGSIVKRLHTAADCARFRAVCRFWRSAMRQYGSPVRHPPPWVFLPDGRFLASHDSSASWRRLASIPKNATCFGSTGTWLALHHVDAENRRRCLLHNPFTGTTVPRPELDAIINDISSKCLVNSVLMPQGPDDDVALATTDFSNYPFVLARFGKGVVLSLAQIITHTGIIVDIAFLGGKLYGIAITGDLYLLDIGVGDDDVPLVISTQIVIEHPYDEQENNHELPEDVDDFHIINFRYLGESRGKLFMVNLQMACHGYNVSFIRKVKVFKADIKAASWKPMVGGLRGQALFISNGRIKFVPACGEIAKDVVYYMDIGGIFSMRTQTNMAPYAQWNDYRKIMQGVPYFYDIPKWIFPPDLVY